MTETEQKPINPEAATPTTPPEKTTKPETKPKTKPTPKPKTKPKKKGKSKPLPKDITTKLENLVLSDDWNREKLGDISGLVADMKENGQLIPLLVRPSSTPGKDEIVDGRRRYAAMQQLKFPTAKITYSRAKNDAEASLESLKANLNREDNTPYEKAMAFHKHVTVYGMTNEKIAKACGCTPGYVSQHLAVIKANKKLQTALKSGNIALVMFRHFAKIDQNEDKEFYDKMVELALNGSSAQTVGDTIDAYVEKKTEKEAKAAIKSGKSPAPKAKKKGAAAHKRKKSTPKLELPDYRSAKIASSIKLVSKKDAIDWLDTYRDKALSATTSRKREYYQGVLMGMEIITGLVKEE